MKGNIEFRYAYRRDQLEPVAQYRYEYYTVKRKWFFWFCFRTYERIKGKWIDLKPCEILYVPIIKSFRQY